MMWLVIYLAAVAGILYLYRELTKAEDRFYKEVHPDDQRPDNDSAAQRGRSVDLSV